ncbi:iron uptake porin [Chamaesiphon sp. OTE_20_metabat_361]|uniref:iron uptake porin n=1 Tax=Chamaesiphon sp. OTE_20_metabat_361 TaxID=2964689 RepID=UPI00286AF79E|nr:iron uptake porin [Chamaesiphon sp. OTE_20_metabat_361]
MMKLLSKNLRSSLLIALAVWIAGTSLAAANPTDKSTEVSPQNNPQQVAAGSSEPSAEQIDQATQATEVKPGDWAYKTLQALGNKYSCSNTPNGTQTLSREEFATSLNGCVQSIEQLVARRKPRRNIKRRRPAVVAPAPVPEAAPEVAPPPPEPAPVAPPPPVVPEVSQQDLDQLKALIQSFNTELQAVDGRLQVLDAKVTKLQAQSFSTTTKLVGEAIFAVTGLAGGPASASRNTIFSDRVRLNFRSSFTGKDLLLVRLQARNSNSFAGTPSGTNMARLGFEGSEENASTLHRLQYQLPLAANTKVYVEAVGSEFNDNYYTFNPEHQAAGTGSITRFGRFNPIYRLSNEGAGIGVDHKFSPGLGLVVSYAVPRVVTPGTATGVTPVTPATTALETVNNPANGSGLFNGSNVLFSQLTIKPSDDVSLGLIYARSYNSAGTGVSGNNGSNFANNPFGSSFGSIAPTSANHYALAGSVNLSPNLIFSAWGGLSQARRETAAGGSADIWNYAGTLAVKDFGSKGSTLGFVLGMQPKVTSNTVGTRVDRDTSLHIEAFYKYKVSDNLYITPGLLMLTNPEHNSALPTEYLGTIRTTFVF